MRFSGVNGRISGAEYSPNSNWRFDGGVVGSVRRPISEPYVPPPGGYTPQVMMVM